MSCGDGDSKGGYERKIGSGPWDARVQFVTDANGRAFAYRPHQLITVRGALPALAALLGIDAVDPKLVRGLFGRPTNDQLELVAGLPNPLELARRLRAAGLRARPNHVFFAAALPA